MNKETDMDKRIKKINELKLVLSDIDSGLINLINTLGWDVENLCNGVTLQEPFETVKCSYNSHHILPKSRIHIHEEKCKMLIEGYNYNTQFPNPNGEGSFVVFDSDLLNRIISGISSSTCGISNRKVSEGIIQSVEYLSRDEKLAIYEYVIANTTKKDCFSDLYMQEAKKKEGKKELTAWELAAAERDAKRRRASYRNKVHTNKKTFTEVMKEVIDSQMESLMGEKCDSQVLARKDVVENENRIKKQEDDSRFEKEKVPFKSHSTRNLPQKRDDYKHRERVRERHSHHSHDGVLDVVSDGGKRSSTKTDNRHDQSESRSWRKYAKWKGSKERFHSHKSNRYYYS